MGAFKLYHHPLFHQQVLNMCGRGDTKWRELPHPAQSGMLWPLSWPFLLLPARSTLHGLMNWAHVKEQHRQSVHPAEEMSSKAWASSPGNKVLTVRLLSNLRWSTKCRRRSLKWPRAADNDPPHETIFVNIFQGSCSAVTPQRWTHRMIRFKTPQT